MDNGIELSKLLDILRTEIATSEANALQQGLSFPVSEIEIEFKAILTRDAGGKTGFSIPFVNAELGGELKRHTELMHSVKIKLGSPLAEDGRIVRVNSSSDEEKG
ncbi:trypco2 family protein [Kineosporia succinea]|uniref:Trypsin-co-occurring domain-containing protein n=1 Tax=Kineosporia succinea TaxID=84632 RepID=A0ABT9NW85_9ACTN|nr:trypco2 family protein [Kineosporia succinea]MDP9824414.1 hypothetical protein [Kineosporia succinea]